MNNKKAIYYKAAFLACVAASPACAWSQTASPGSKIELYGRLDASLNEQRFSATANKAARSANFLSSDTSFWGIRGSEDLGGGMRAYFKLENGFNLDTGAQSSPTVLFNRESYVGLGSTTAGSLQLGSQWTPSLLLTAKTDPFLRSNTGAIFTLFQQGGAAGPRGYFTQYNNAIQYISPTVGGFMGRIMIAANETVAAPYGNPASASLEYAGGRLFIGASYDRLNALGSSAEQVAKASVLNTTVSAGATYQFDTFKVHGYLIKNEIDGTFGMKGGMLGVSVPVGSGQIVTSAQRRKVDDAANSTAQLFALQYNHFLSKRTMLYAGAARQRNAGNASFGIWPSRIEAAATLGLPVAGQSVSAYQVGMRHTF